MLWCEPGFLRLVWVLEVLLGARRRIWYLIVGDLLPIGFWR